jgi:predicted Zn-dependent peptidase
MIINLNSTTDFSGFYIVFEGSTNIEKPGIYGISHLMEHLICKSFEKYREEFVKNGIDWNASTSSNEIIFYFTGLEDKLTKYRGKLVDLMSEFNVTKKQFENEKQIILEEYSDTFNEQTESHILNLNRKLFNDYGAIGLKSDLEKLKFMDCIKFFELQYLKPTKIINVSKKYKFKASDIDFSDMKIDRKIECGNHDVALELGNDFRDKTSIAILSPVINEDFPYIDIINNMLSKGLSSPLYSEIREKLGLIYYIRCGLSRTNQQGITTISTQTINKNAEKVIDSIGKIIKNPSKFMTKERFAVIKEYMVNKERKEEINRYLHIDDWIEPENWSVSKIIKDVKFDKIMEMYEKHFDFDKFYISNDKKEFKK